MIFEKQVFPKLISLFLKMLKIFSILHPNYPWPCTASHVTSNNNSSATSGQKEHHAGDDGRPAGRVDDLHQDDGQDLLRPLQLWWAIFCCVVMVRGDGVRRNKFNNWYTSSFYKKGIITMDGTLSIFTITLFSFPTMQCSQMKISTMLMFYLFFISFHSELESCVYKSI